LFDTVDLECSLADKAIMILFDNMVLPEGIELSTSPLPNKWSTEKLYGSKIYINSLEL